MSAKVNLIPGFLPEKRPYSKPPASELNMTEGRSGYSEGWDNVIDQMATKTLNLIIENTAKRIHEYWREQCFETGTIKPAWEDLHKDAKQAYHEEAIYLNASLQTLLTVETNNGLDK